MMNILHDVSIFNLNMFPEKTDNDDINNKEWTIGEKNAVGIVLVCTVFSLMIGLWSGVLLFTENTANGGPIGIIFDTFLREWLNNL